MKKRILSLVLALLMAIPSAGFVAADEATAAADENNYESAVDFLHSYGIYKGDGSSLAVDEDIERYQMALFVARISTGWVDDEKWEETPENTTDFTDIVAGEEASAYLGAISYAGEKGIIKGYGNGEFGPYDGITYQDALTMVVRTLGYTDLEWPWGFIEQAVKLGLTDGINGVAYTDILTRGEVAQIIYNALFAAMNGGSTLAHTVFGTSEWTPIVITASDRDIFEPNGTYAKGDFAENTWVSFKIFDPATGYIAEATKGDVYYAEAKDLGMSVARYQDDLAVGSTYWVVFKQDAEDNFVDVLKYRTTVVDTLWNMGKTDDAGDALGWAVNEYLSARTVVTQFTPANYLSDTKYLKPELMLYSALDNIQIIDKEYGESKLAVDMETGDILVTNDGGNTYEVIWYWNAVVSKYFKHILNTENGIIGIEWMKEGEFVVEDYNTVLKETSRPGGMLQLTAAPGVSAYSSLVLEDVNGDGEADRAIYEEYGLGYYSDGKLEKVTPSMAANDGEGAFASKGTIRETVALASDVWFAEGYRPTKNGYVLYSYDVETHELKIVKEIYDKDAKARKDADSYVDFGILRAYSISQNKIYIGDDCYTASYAELKNNGFTGTSLAEGLESMLNQYVEFVVLDGELVAMNLQGVSADSAYLIVKEYAGLTNDGYVAVEAYNAKNGRLGLYCIASYNGNKQGDYYYYMTDEKIKEAFKAGSMYYIKSYDEEADAYNVEIVGEYNEIRGYEVDSSKISLSRTSMVFQEDGYRVLIGQDGSQRAYLMTDSDTYIIIPKKGTGDDKAPFYYYRGKVPTDSQTSWMISGDRIVNIGDTIVIVNATGAVEGFDLDAYQSEMYLYEGGKVVEAAYDSYYDGIFDGEFKDEDRYILGAVRYCVQALNLYTGVREYIDIDRNIDLKKGYIYTTVSGTVVEEAKPASDGEIYETPATAFMNRMQDFYGDTNVESADYLFGAFEYEIPVPASDDVDEDEFYKNFNEDFKDTMNGVLADPTSGWYQYKRDRVKDVVTLFVTYSADGNTMTVVNYNNLLGFIRSNKSVLELDCSYVYDVSSGKMVVYANADKLATMIAGTQSLVLKENVNDVEGVNLVMEIKYVNYYDVDHNLERSEINNVKFYYTGAENMRHNDRAAAGLAFGHLSQHANGSYVYPGSGLLVNDELVLDLYTAGQDNEAVKYTTWACEHELCDLINGIEFDMTKLGLITVTATDVVRVIFTLTVDPAIGEEGIEISMTSSNYALAGSSTSTAKVDTSNGNVGGTIIYSTEDTATYMGDSIFDGDFGTEGSIMGDWTPPHEGDFYDATLNWVGIKTDRPIVPSYFVLGIRHAGKADHFTQNSMIQGSVDGVNWTTIVSITGEASNDGEYWIETGTVSGANGVNVNVKKLFIAATDEAYTYFRFIRKSPIDVCLNEFQVFELEPEEEEYEPIEGSPIHDQYEATWKIGASIKFKGTTDITMSREGKQIINGYAFLAANPDDMQSNGNSFGSNGDGIIIGGATGNVGSDNETSEELAVVTINGVDISQYVIVTNSSAGGVMSRAADELQKYIELTTGHVLSITTQDVAENRILIDETTVDDDSSMRIFSDSKGIVLAGTARRSALYAVYHFLETCLDWRFFSSDTEVTYSGGTTRDLSNVLIDYTLPYDIRGVYELDYHNKDLSVKRYQNEEGQRRMSNLVEYGYDEAYSPNGVHTFGPLNGSGDGYSDPQPCLNDEIVRERMLRNIHAWLDENWGTGNRSIKSIHVSQNDNAKYCKCDDCLADLEYYGTLAGSIIEFVNWVAEDLETYNGGRYKDVLIMTFAYQYSFDCPKNIVCHDQIMIQFAPIEMCYQHAIDDPDCTGTVEVTPNYELTVRSNADMYAEIEKWKQICDKYFLWDYGVNFRYFLSPFPNFDVLLANYRYFNEIGLWGYVYQANNFTPSAEFGVLRSYLIAKITEDPDMTEAEYDNHINEFLKAYYGDGAWRYIREYFDYLQELSNSYDHCFGIYNSPELMFGDLNDKDNPNSFVNKSEWLGELFDSALAADGLTDTQKLHIRYLRTGCDYLRLGATHQTEMNSGDYNRQITQMQANQRFYNSLIELGQTRLTEGFSIPSSINSATNIRTWINNTTLHWYSE